MQEFLTNHYVRLTLLTIAITTLFFVMFSLLLHAMDVDNFSVFLRLLVSVLAAGYLVYKLFANRIGM